MKKSKEELKSLLKMVKEESEKASLKLNIQKTKIMASGPITSWQIDGETMETVRAFIFLGSKIIVDGDCSHEIKRSLLLGRKAMTNLNGILKRRHLTLRTKYAEYFEYAVLLWVVNGTLLQYSCTKNFMDTGVWWATESRGSQKNQTWLSTLTPNLYCLK